MAGKSGSGGSGAASSSTALYSFVAAAGAIVGAAALKRLLKREPLFPAGETRAKYAKPAPDTLPVFETDTKRAALEKASAAAGGSAAAGSSAAKGLSDLLETAHYAVGRSSRRPIAYAPRGIASLPAVTVMEAFAKAVENHGSVCALKVERGGDFKWSEWTWRQYYDGVLCCARALIALGMAPYQSLNILGFNSPEWLIADIAAIAVGGKAAGIYPSNTAAACAYITQHSEAFAVIVENDVQLKKYVDLRDSAQLPASVKAIVVYAPGFVVPAGVNAAGKVPVMTWAELMALGAVGGEAGKKLQSELDARIAALTPTQCSTLIYTSGTTGNPKAVMISHDNATWTARLVAHTRAERWADHEHILSYLPLSHIAAQMLDVHIPMCVTAYQNIPVTLWFARPDALKSSLPISLRACRPTMFLGVPRVWEKIEEKMREVGAQTTGLRKRLVDWAKGLGTQAFVDAQIDGTNDLHPRYHWIAKALVFDRVRENLGLDRCTTCYSGAAPISQATVNFFGQFGLSIYEVYGMSECSGPQCIATSKLFKVGAVGVPLAGTELRVDHVPGRDKAGEGELTYRGRHVMMGYLNGVGQTQEAIDCDGFLHSGDVGRQDEQGMVYITGRIKELIIGAGGENIAPVPVEDAIKAQLPALSNVMMYGDRRKFNTALFTLHTSVDDSGAPTNVLVGAAAAVSAESKTVEEAVRDPKWRAYLDAGLARANKQAVSNAQTVQKYAIAPVDFSVAGGELTATLKLKRSVVAQKYFAALDALYA